MARVYLPGQTVQVPIVATFDLNTGRTSVANGTVITYGSISGFGTPDGWQVLQADAFTTPPSTLAQYGLYQSDGNVNVYSAFVAFENLAGINFGDGTCFLDSSGTFLTIRIPTAATITGVDYHTFISGPPFPSHYSDVPQGSGNYVGRYSIIVQLTTGSFPYTGGSGTRLAFASDWFDVALQTGGVNSLVALDNMNIFSGTIRSG